MRGIQLIGSMIVAALFALALIPAAGHVLLLRQKNVTEEKATLPHRPCGLPSPDRKSRVAAQLALRAQTVLAPPPRLSRPDEAVQKGNPPRANHRSLGRLG